MHIYKSFIRPILFQIDAEKIHEAALRMPQHIAKYSLFTRTLQSIFCYKHKSLNKELDGLRFENPVGLAAGFDYDGTLADVMQYIGFGFNTVGTVTYHEYEGNKRPMLTRLIDSKAIVVNKGFKSEGVEKVTHRLKRKNLTKTMYGVSVGSSNIPEIDTIDKAISDYINCFTVLKSVETIKYYELNISCPNTTLTESFTDPKNFRKLIGAVKNLNLGKPVFLKMPNSKDTSNLEQIVDSALDYGITTYIFSNLLKDKTVNSLTPEDQKKAQALQGNISGKPTFELSNHLIRHFRKKYGNKINIIGCGGIMSIEDAKTKLECGADLIQLITGMIYEGPQLIKSINKNLCKK